MSGGEQQRVAVARALVHKPAFVLADEPTGNLDSTNTAAVLDLLIGLNLDGTTVILITHDQEVAGKSSRRISFKDGKIDDSSDK
jgi:ABC-type lipoprotein export system ATPase subunit